jgi:hypothetical protein
MNKLFKHWLFLGTRPPLLLIGFIGSLIHRSFFAGAAKRHAEEREVQLAATVTKMFAFLFDLSSARIIARDPTLEFPPPFDLAYVFVVKGHIAYRFLRGRDEEAVSLRLAGTDDRWNELSVVLDLVDAPEQVKLGSIDGFYAASRLLRSNLKAIEEAFSEAHYPELREKLDDWYTRHKIRLKALSTELNRQLYG